LLPNLTYNPRACVLPPSCITDGSVAIITPIDESTKITKNDLAFYATEEFTQFYAVARNMGSRSLNIDNNSVFFFGKLKDK
jgi:DNA (cytosine-5)-methyltransferase 1